MRKGHDLITRLIMRKPFIIVVMLTLVALASGVYAWNNLSITVDTDALFDPDLPFVQRDHAYRRLFPNEGNSMIVLINADQEVSAMMAADRLAQRLKTYSGKKGSPIKKVINPGGGDFMARNGILLLPSEEFQDQVERLIGAQPMIASLNQQAHLGGFFQLIDQSIRQLAYADEATVRNTLEALQKFNGGLAAILEEKQQVLNWNALVTASDPTANQSRPFAVLLVSPNSDSTKIGGTQDAYDLVRKQAQAEGLTADQGYQIRLTGSLPLDDEELQSIEQGSALSGTIALVLVILLLVRAIRSKAMIFAMIYCLIIGCLLTLGWATFAVGRLNVISVAFLVLFVGISVDFGIQYSLRFIHRRCSGQDLHAAMQQTGAEIRRPVAIAALTTTIGFFAFIPTEYQGVAELGIITGGGIMIAALLIFILMPALILLLKPGAVKHVTRLAGASILQHFIVRHHHRIISVAALATALSIVSLFWLRFDYNPLHLKDPNAPSMVALRDMAKSDWGTPYTMSLITDDSSQEHTWKVRLEKLPEVRAVTSLSDLIPQDVDSKMLQIEDAQFIYDESLYSGESPPKPTIEQLRQQVAKVRKRIAQITVSQEEKTVDVLRNTDKLLLRIDHEIFPKGNEAISRLEKRLLSGFFHIRDSIMTILQAEPFALADVPDDVQAQFITSDGRRRLLIYPAAGISPEVFAAAIKRITPEAMGPPATIVESGQAILRAFRQAMILALVSISILLWIMLRNLRDILLSLAPTILAGIWTLGSLTLLGIPLNFANIIGLPLLLGIGIDFSVYLNSHWRDHPDPQLEVLFTPTVRAIFYCALLTGAAFGSLALSTHRGTASLGLLLSLCLTYLMIASLVLLPALYRSVHHRRESG